MLLVVSIVCCWAAMGLCHTPSMSTLTQFDTPCTECHTCDTPTTVSPCLLACPRFAAVETTSVHTLPESPDTVVLDLLTDLYQAVQFNHGLHANMAQMGHDCATCHHYSPPGQIPPCRECHGSERSESNLEQPSLKGAYHRHCLTCHREWSHETKCIVCHLPTPGRAMAPDGFDSTDIMGVPHPRITEPGKRVYQTPYEQGPVVTFYHNAHVDLFGLRCVDCHQEESCSRCHDITRPARYVKSDEEIHATCNGCHLEDECGKCHSTQELPAFTHDVTGWPLNRFHRQLDCRACHPTGRPIARLNRDCSSCHRGWNSDNFDHAITGLTLDETHRDLDCEDCHGTPRFASPPGCAECHDDGRSADTHPPGRRLSQTSK